MRRSTAVSNNASDEPFSSNDVASQSELDFSRGQNRRTGTAGGSRTLTGQGLNLLPLPDWATAARCHPKSSDLQHTHNVAARSSRSRPEQRFSLGGRSRAATHRKLPPRMQHRLKAAT